MIRSLSSLHYFLVFLSQVCNASLLASIRESLKCINNPMANYKFSNFLWTKELSQSSNRQRAMIRAYDQTANQIVALKHHKITSPMESQFATNEIKALDACRQIPWVLALLGHIYPERGGRIILATEYINGNDLSKVLRYSIHSNLRSQIRKNFSHFTAVLVSALAAIQQRGIVHGHLKLENVMLTVTGEIKIVDFAFATSVEESGNFVPSMWCHFYGSPANLAPETLLNGTRGFASDWYALGVLLHQFYMAKSIYPNISCCSTFRNIVANELPTVDQDMPLELRDFILKLLQFDPNDRWGYHNSMESIKAHPLFLNVDWDLIVYGDCYSSLFSSVNYDLLNDY